MSRVLVVDDEKNILATLSIGLKRSDYPVMQARSGPEALEILDNNPCDIVVSDIRMSPMDGYTLAREINAKYPRIGIVLMSAYGFDDWKPNTGDIPQYPRLVKPFEVSELVAVLKQEEARQKSSKTLPEFKEKILCYAATDHVVALREIIGSGGGQLDVIQTMEAFVARLKKEIYDAFIVDGEQVSQDMGKVLNRIDQSDKEKPVFMLTSKTGAKESAQASDSNVMIIDRDAFFRNSDWAVEQLKKGLR